MDASIAPNALATPRMLARTYSGASVHEAEDLVGGLAYVGKRLPIPILAGNARLRNT
jgi:hypothetical protein